MSKYIVVATIGTKNINIAVGEITKSNELKIVNLVSKVTKEKISRDDFKKLLRELLNEAFEELEFKPEIIYLGLDNKDFRISETYCSMDKKDSGKINSNDIKKIILKSKRKVVLNSNEEIIDSKMNFFMIDGRTVKKSILGWRGNNITENITHVIYKQSRVIDEYKEIFNEIGIKTIHSKSNSISVAAMMKQVKENRLEAMIEVGSTNTNITIINNGVAVDSIHIKIGGDHITSDISICCNYPKMEAERLKCILSDRYNIENIDAKELKVGTTLINRELFQEVINARIKEILSFIKIQLKNTGYYDKINSIILYGDGISNFNEIDKEAKLKFGNVTYVLTKKTLDLQKSSYINTLAIVKEVYNELKLIYGQDVLRYCHDNFKVNHIRKMNTWFTKVKKILGEGF